MAKLVKPSPAARGRGRPRDLGARDAILEAARALLDEGGPGAVTIEAVALRAGVSRPTVYRWWPDRHAVAMAALMVARDRAPPSPSGPGEAPSAIDALRSALVAIGRRFATPTGRHVTSMIAAADRESELAKAFRTHFVLARRAEGKVLLERAIVEGHVRADADVEATLDMLYGAIFFRLMMGHAPVGDAFVEGIVDAALAGIGRARRAAKATR